MWAAALFSAASPDRCGKPSLTSAFACSAARLTFFARASAGDYGGNLLLPRPTQPLWGGRLGPWAPLAYCWRGRTRPPGCPGPFP